MPGADRAARVRRTRLPAEKRRESILDAATEVFAAAGYRAGKVSEVAARIGVTEPVIFQNFGSKAALYAAVLDRVAGQIRAKLKALAAQHGSMPDLLAHVLSPHPGAQPHGGGSHRGALFADAATLAADPDLGEPARQVAGTLAGHLADVLRQGQADGTIRADADPEAGAWLLLSVLASRPFRTAAMPDRDRHESSVAALALQALMPSAGRGPHRGWA
ncbi:MAG TPA: TetR/AcrR family transcriptional regulator [Streptosporangiaceae bacterium]|nr:TetR/AcrR family transcriptional regulator [Streptosporangiaceae bacterium]